MSQPEGISIHHFYEHVQRAGKLQTQMHAKVWTSGVLGTFGTVLNRKTKKALKKVLPEELNGSLGSVFRLMHFRNPNQPAQDFLHQAGKRSGNSDPEFALYPTLAVFSGLKLFINSDLNQKIADVLSPEVADIWNRAAGIEVDLSLESGNSKK